MYVIMIQVDQRNHNGPYMLKTGRSKSKKERDDGSIEVARRERKWRGGGGGQRERERERIEGAMLLPSR